MVNICMRNVLKNFALAFYGREKIFKASFLFLAVLGSFMVGLAVDRYALGPWPSSQPVVNYYVDYYNRTVTQLNETYFINASYFLVAEFNLTFVFSFRDNTSNAVVGFYFLTGDNRALLYYSFLRGVFACVANATLTIGSYDLLTMNYTETVYNASDYVMSSFIFSPRTLVMVWWEFWDIVILAGEYPFSLYALIEIFP